MELSRKASFRMLFFGAQHALLQSDLSYASYVSAVGTVHRHFRAGVYYNVKFVNIVNKTRECAISEPACLRRIRAAFIASVFC